MMDIGLAYIENICIVAGKDIGQCRGDSGPVVARYIDQNKFYAVHFFQNLTAKVAKIPQPHTRLLTTTQTAAASTEGVAGTMIDRLQHKEQLQFPAGRCRILSIIHTLRTGSR